MELHTEKCSSICCYTKSILRRKRTKAEPAFLPKVKTHAYSIGIMILCSITIVAHTHHKRKIISKSALFLFSWYTILTENPETLWVSGFWSCSPVAVPDIFLVDKSTASATDPGTHLCFPATTQQYIGIEPQRIEQAIQNHAQLMWSSKFIICAMTTNAKITPWCSMLHQGVSIA